MRSATTRTTRRVVPGLLLPALLLATACGTDSPLVGFCAAPRSLAIEVAVTDSSSGLSVADSAAGSVQRGTQVDSLQHISPASALLVGGTELGTYDVAVTRPGYAPWSRPRVAVTQVGPCGDVVPVHLEALMQPAP